MKKKFLIPLMATALLAMTGVVVSCGGTKPETGEKTVTDQKPGENQGENNPGGNQGENQVKTIQADKLIQVVKLKKKLSYQLQKQQFLLAKQLKLPHQLKASHLKQKMIPSLALTQKAM